jgi:hypothetical protein
LRSEIASYLPAVFIFSSCYTSADATRNGGVPWLSLLSDRWHPAGCLSYRIAGILPALLLMERWSPDRQSLSFLPAARQ